MRPDHPSTLFSAVRLNGLVAIIVTGVVYHIALAQALDLRSRDELGNALVHTVVPILVPSGWLLFGPRRFISARIAARTLAFSVLHLSFTLIRGALQPFYP